MLFWTRRSYFLGKAALSRGDDRRAEILLLEAVDAEPTTYGACAALLSVLRQVWCGIGRIGVELSGVSLGIDVLRPKNGDNHDGHHCFFFVYSFTTVSRRGEPTPLSSPPKHRHAQGCMKSFRACSHYGW